MRHASRVIAGVAQPIQVAFAARTAGCAVLSILLGLLAGQRAAHAGTWTNLWLTPAQQGERLLANGHPEQAAHVFKDPRRQAYADLASGQYTAAAKLLAPYKDADSLYNRGNALARSGHLHAALNAYDAALKQAPHDRDVRHNRDLVARALRKKEKNDAAAGHGGGSQAHNGAGQGGKGSSQGGQSQGGQANAHSPRSGGSKGGQASSPAHGGPRNPARSNQARGSQPPQSNTAAGSAAAPSGHAQSTGAARSGANAGKPPSAQQGQGGMSQSAQSKAGGSAAAAAQAARQAKHDAAAAVGLLHPHQSSSGTAGSQPPTPPASGGKAHSPATPPPPKHETEQDLALDQWLRRIPDNPGGLLRRKFLIEHMLRQQHSSQQ